MSRREGKAAAVAAPLSLLDRIDSLVAWASDVAESTSTALRPSMTTAVVLVFASYAFITSGIFYDLINETPAMGSVADAHGRITAQTIMPGRLNGQFIIEGLIAGGMFTLGGAALVMLDWGSSTPRHASDLSQRVSMQWACLCTLALVMLMSWVFIRIKMPGYLTTYSE